MNIEERETLIRAYASRGEKEMAEIASILIISEQDPDLAAKHIDCLIELMYEEAGTTSICSAHQTPDKNCRICQTRLEILTDEN